MRLKQLKATLRTAFLGATVLLLAAGMARAQQVVNLTAAPTHVNLPDGSQAPMWGYTCGTAAPACAAANPNAAGNWSPVVITVPFGQELDIYLTNNLSFTTTGAPNNIPTSIVIVGQLGGGLGDTSKEKFATSP